MLTTPDALNGYRILDVTLKYDTRQGGYVVGINADQLKDAPTYGANEMPAWGDRAFETRIHDYYKAVPYWGA